MKDQLFFEGDYLVPLDNEVKFVAPLEGGSYVVMLRDGSYWTQESLMQKLGD